jgi:ATP-dependent protease ClpP protease subunit
MRELITLPSCSVRLLAYINETRTAMESKFGRMRVEFTNAKDDEPAEIAIYGFIGDPYDGANASTFGRFLRENKKKPVNVRLNSPGGLVYDGITIHNAILQHDGPVTTTVDGEAGSAASIIAVAGSPARVFENGTFFIHRASVGVQGNSDTLREALTWLEQINESIVGIYHAKSGRQKSKIMEQLVGPGGDGTPFTAKEAVAQKYLDEVIPLKRQQDQKPRARAEGMGGTMTEAQLHQARREARNASIQ